MATRKGQALIELAIGLLAAALVLAGLFGFGRYIIASMDGARTMRADAGVRALNAMGGDGSYASASHVESVAIPELAGERIFGDGRAEIKEEVHIPLMGLQE